MPTAASPPGATTAKQIAAFLAKYTPEIAGQARALRKAMRARLPGGVEFVYDNYAGLVFGYGPTDRPSEAIFSLFLNPRHVTLCFLKGATLPDPERILKGGGNVVRNAVLDGPLGLKNPAIERLIALALKTAKPPFPRAGTIPTVIRSVSAKQRPRRPR